MEAKHSSSYSALLNFNVDEQSFYNNLFDNNKSNYQTNSNNNSNNNNNLDLFAQQFLNDVDNFMFQEEEKPQQPQPQLSQYDNFNQVEQLNSSINEALLGFQSLDLPSGMAELNSSNNVGTKQHHSQQSYKRHSKKPSGTAIFGFHGRELSIPGINPIDLKDVINTLPSSNPSASGPTIPSPAKERNTRRLNKIIDPKAITLSKDYIITSNRPTSYKFPPDPPTLPTNAKPQPSQFASEIAKMMPKQTIGHYGNNIQEILDTTVSQPPQNLRGSYHSHSPMAENSESCYPTPIATANPSPVKRSFNVNNMPLQPPNSYPERATPDLKSQNTCAPPNIYMTPSPKYSQFSQNAPSFTSPEEYTYMQTTTPSSSHNSSPLKSIPNPNKEQLSWEGIMAAPQTSNSDNLVSSSPPQMHHHHHHHTYTHQKPKRKGADKVSTLPPGYIDQFILGPDNNKKYICNYNNCGKVFQRRYNIRSHIQTHLCDRPYKCSFDGCSKSFVRQHDLHRHEKIHENNKFSCLCGKGFTRIDALRRHKERNICVGGIETDANINKPKKKRGRPKKIAVEDDKKLADKLEQTVQNAFNVVDMEENKRKNDSEFFIYEEDKENSFSGTSNGRNSAPLTPISFNGSRKVLPLTARLH
ncbi:DNA-binding transcription factor [Saccharomycopsis crataegensis]|uniref:DNA-binding transcription factor n=1 Tax=Saccharomycopsis crataegensis TaxID=43959 RepID=A0AAV5QWL6_9ASCO|nr:DNA-binding transcription factor [Saccharomycopsis crataegensis]